MLGLVFYLDLYNYNVCSSDIQYLPPQTSFTKTLITVELT